MVRKLKHHEKKLLKKVDFFHWKKEDNIREIKIMRKYHIQKREDYQKYNRICGHITELANKISLLPAQDPFRAEISKLLLRKLYVMGVIGSDVNLSQVSQIPASAFCRRRLPVVMARLKMAQSLTEATTYIEQGQIRVGPEIVTDPAFLVTRNLEDFVTWTDGSKIRRHIMQYNDQVDDFELMN
jgi:U3 small nucleolar ribonucleoprotein protein IMP3